MKKSLLLIVGLMPLLGFSQYEFYNKGAEVYVQQGALLHVQGTITNTNGSANGLLQNDGIVELKGDFENTSGATVTHNTLTSSLDRAVRFVGTGKQVIKGDLSTGSNGFYNLIVDQLSDADTIEMQTNTVVKGSVVFGSQLTTATYVPSMGFSNHGTHGLLKTYDNTGGEFVLDVQSSGTDAVKGYPTQAMGVNANSSYILTKGTRGSANGGFQRRVNSLAAYDFPIGTADNGYNSTRLTFSNIPAGGGSIKAKFCDSTDNPRGYVGTISQYCDGCNNQNYPTPDNLGYNHWFAWNPCNSNEPQWLILEESGVQSHGYWSFDATDNNLGQWQYVIETFPNSYFLESGAGQTMRTIKYHDSNNDFGANPSYLTVDWRPQIEDVSDPFDLLTYTLNTGCYSGSGVPGGVYTDFSHFSIHTSNSSNALPVELISLKAEPVNNKFIRVKWATAIEVNNQGFEVYRSTDAKNFQKIGWVDGHNNSTTIQNYFLDDKNVEANVVYYYKLRQLDYDGHSSETHIVSASLNGENVFVISDFVPNPSRFASRIVVNTSTNQTIGVQLYDAIGRKVEAERQYNLTKGDNYIDFNVENYAAGTYNAVINAANDVYSRKLVITNQ